MKTVLVDVDVILDVLLDRKPHAEASAAMWAAVETGLAAGLISGHAVTTIHYLVRKELGAVKVTRDPKGFRGSPVRPLTPEATIPLLSIG